MKIKLVDGFKIRNTVDINFAVIEDHYASPSLVPAGEIWLEKEYWREKDEIVKYYIKFRALTKKHPLSKARKEFILPAPAKPVPVKIKSLGKFGKNRIFLVNGHKVRQTYDHFFFLGGHYRVYKYVPKNEVWIDDTALTKDRKYTLIHEFYELELMDRGMNYENAHKHALDAEKGARMCEGIAKFI